MKLRALPSAGDGEKPTWNPRTSTIFTAHSSFSPLSAPRS